jgi:mannosyltransferase OCH1-like enzyme
MRELPMFLDVRTPNVGVTPSQIPKNIIQTFRSNQVHDVIHDSVMQMLDANPDYKYYLITNELGEAMIKKHFDDRVLAAYRRLNVGAAKGDFIRYIAMYILGGVYLDLDSGMYAHLSEFVCPVADHIFFMDWDCNIQQWCFMCAPGHSILLKIIDEMVHRIHSGVENIFLATGPTLFNDVVMACIRNENIVFNTKHFFNNEQRRQLFMTNSTFGKGLILDGEANGNNDKFKERLSGYREEFLYDTEAKYIVTYDAPTPGLYINAAN